MDAIICLHLLRGFHETAPATRGVLEWMLYTVSFTVKLCIFYFVVFEGRLEQNLTYYSALGGIGYDVSAEVMVLAKSYAFCIMVYLAPLLFAFWVGRGSKEVFEYSNYKVTIESLIYCDIALHVILDLVDCCTAFRFSTLIYDFRGRHPRLETANGVVMALGILCHSLSLPSFSSSSFEADTAPSKSAQVEAVERKDVYLTRKFVALTSVLVIDVPMIIIRVLFWKHGYGFQVFLFKNVISIPLSIFRLNYTTYRAATAIDQPRPEDFPGKSDVVRTNLPSGSGPQWNANTIPKPSDALGLGADLNRLNDLRLGDPRLEALGGGGDHLGGVGEHLGATDAVLTSVLHRLYADDQLRENDWKAIEKNLLDCSRINKPLFPVRTASMQRVIVKIMQCATAGGRHSIGERLDAGLVLPYWKVTRLAAGLLVHWACQITAVGILSFWTTDSIYCVEADCSVITFRFWRDPYDSSWAALSILALSAGTVNFLAHVGTVNVLDSLFTSALYMLRSFSLWWSIWTFRKLNVFDIDEAVYSIFGARPFGSLSLDGATLFVVCGVPVVVSLMQGLFFVQSAFLSRKFMYYALQPHSRVARRLASSGRGRDAEPKTDECGWISTSSILSFLVCKNHIAPVDHHQLLIGPNVIRGVRLCDMLLVSDWMALLIAVCIRAVATLLYGYDTSRSDTSLWIFLINVLYLTFEIIYILLTQTVRLLSIRRFQIKALYTDIVTQWTKQNETLTHENKMATLAQVLVRYRREAFLTSPGEILPPLL
ncbi:putative transmembrane protein [Gregarina niphandrodes]|uniref:Transmembrane protein n=1 Tax=Gregarina niphandrodes TaxID=110365 RepID=A0A023B8E2_GRENI|nr:putative transmembrane protein [Gregarina niphandrodes]EZG68679.1 putative transmembrane protein [Gregarina niphandrodes]|eukprot:XP_011134557.1 putative transmembrane protein [Gregarina niphandrodes]